MKRVIVADKLVRPGASLDLTDEKSHYLAKVLRCKPGELIMVGDGQGSFYKGEVLESGSALVRVHVGEQIKIVWEEDVELHLIQSLPKGNKLERIVRAATELGVTAIYPVVTRRSIPRLDVRKRHEKVERLRRIAEQAARQCGRPNLPVLHEITEYAEVVEHFAGGGEMLKLQFWEAEPRRSLFMALNSIRDPVKKAVLCVGPEGGWATDEIELARECGFESIYFGHGILRVETAAVGFLSIIKFYLNMREHSH
jgi:16S rRNA (uracil1498-N3)-methyltransferase